MTMDWSQILADPCLKDLPYKIETNEFGAIEMTPAKNWHVRLQARIARKLDDMIPDGEVLCECSVGTADGVKVPDVAWLSAAFLARHESADPYPQAPELCIEVVSRSNSTVAMARKRGLYFERGSEECWLCSEKGEIRFFDARGEVDSSSLFPEFPKSI
jgi:Uma2 family endonuclease